MNQLKPWPLVVSFMVCAKVTKCTSAPAQKDEWWWHCDTAKVWFTLIDGYNQVSLSSLPQPWLLHHTGLLGWRDGGDPGGDHVQVHHAQQQGAHQGGHLQVRILWSFFFVRIVFIPWYIRRDCNFKRYIPIGQETAIWLKFLQRDDEARCGGKSWWLHTLSTAPW